MALSTRLNYITQASVADPQTIALADAGGYYDPDNVEGALQSVGSQLAQNTSLISGHTIQIGQLTTATELESGLILAIDSRDFSNFPKTTLMPDKSCNNNDAIPTNFNYSSVSGADGLGGLVFEGIDDFLDVPHSPSVNLAGNITLEAVFKFNSVAAIQDIVNKTNSSGYSLEFSLNSDQKIGFYAHIGGSYRGAKSNAALEAGVLYHIVGRYNGTAVELFVNGVKQTGGTSITGAVATNTVNLRVGVAMNGTDFNFNGVLYSLKLYNIALTDADIALGADRANTVYTHHAFNAPTNTRLDIALDIAGDDQFIRQIAHAGYSSAAPENTIPAFALAKQRGFKFVEGDVMWSSDNIPVMCHDATIDRTSDGTGNVVDFTYAQLLTYDFGSWFSTDYTGTRIPSFRNWILFCKKLNIHPYIEIKSAIDEAQAIILHGIVRELGMLRHCTWISYSKVSLGLIKAIDANADFALALSGNAVSDGVALLSGSNKVSMTIDYTTLTTEIAAEISTAGLGIIAWVVNSASVLDGLADKGVTEIFTDSLDMHRYFHMAY